MKLTVSAYRSSSLGNLYSGVNISPNHSTPIGSSAPPSTGAVAAISVYVNSGETAERFVWLSDRSGRVYVVSTAVRDTLLSIQISSFLLCLIDLSDHKAVPSRGSYSMWVSG